MFAYETEQVVVPRHGDHVLTYDVRFVVPRYSHKLLINDVRSVALHYSPYCTITYLQRRLLAFLPTELDHSKKIVPILE